MLSKNNFEKKKPYFKVNTLKLLKIYLLSSRINNKLPIYFSYRPNPDAIAVDALSLSWNNYEF